jgi:2-hydroxychromene-2-carboxylate isomerase
MASIDYYFSTLSIYAYLAGGRLEEIAARHGREINYKPMDIMGLFERTGGVPPAQRHPARQEYRLQEIRRQGKKAGLPVNSKPAFFPTNPAPSCYAIIAAQTAARGGSGGDIGALVQGVLRACFADDKDIADDAVIAACLKDAGFDPGLTTSGLLSGAETYARNTEEAVEAGVFGSPFYVCEDGERFWGQDRLDDLDAHLAGTL